MKIKLSKARLLISLISILIAVLLIRALITPKVLDRHEIYDGIWLTVMQTTAASGKSSLAMIVEVHWDTPGIRISNRRLSFPHDPRDESVPHYRLKNADWALATSGAAVLMNTTRYDPHKPLRSLPGFPVRSVETVVDDNQVSHVHQHSYLLFIDVEGSGHQLLKKPPDPHNLAQADWGIGIQGVQVVEGKPHYHALSDLTNEIPRSFIGMDPGNKTLYLLAFDKIDGRTMIDEAVAAGVVFGGQVDSGGSTNMLIGAGANGVRSHTGIRNWRPLGAYLTIHAEKVNK